MSWPDPVVLESSVKMESAASALWPFLADTDRSNRLLIGNAATYEPIARADTRDTTARYVVETRAGGFPMVYEEEPYEWTLHKSLSVYRTVLKGPIRAMSYSMELEPTSDGGTLARFRLVLEPKYALLRPFVRRSGRRYVAAMTKLANEIDRHVLTRVSASPYEQPTTPASLPRLADAREELVGRGLAIDVVDAVVVFVEKAADADLVRIRPFELAEQKNLDPRETLRVLLHAVTVGLFELRWALVCPSCRVASATVDSLDAIGESSHCQMCDLTFGVELDRAVEATFRPHPSAREVSDKLFCMAGPWRTPHVLVQRTLDARATKDIEAVNETGRFRLFARGGTVASVEVAAGAPAQVGVTLREASFEPAELQVAPGGTIRITNATTESLHLKLERLGYASLAATAQLVTTMPEFRRYFSTELLKASTPLKVATCAIMFSDLTGSTALYTHAGDAAAFRFVDDHFDVLRTAIEHAEGTVVKTMGDAVMAAFLDPVAGTRAMVEGMRAFEAFRLAHPHGSRTGLKLGLFAGPCYVVTANEALDYFGQTVNCAARVQHLAESGEIVVALDVLERLPPNLRGELRVVERFASVVKGIERPLQLVRLRVFDPT